jgi:hypothetical protein
MVQTTTHTRLDFHPTHSEGQSRNAAVATPAANSPDPASLGLALSCTCTQGEGVPRRPSDSEGDVQSLLGVALGLMLPASFLRQEQMPLQVLCRWV